MTCSDMVEQCLAGQDAAWKHFVSQYLPFAAAVLDRHFPQLGPRREDLLRKTLLETRAEDARFFRDYRGQSEREFLLHLREHVQRVARGAAPPPPAPEIPLDWEIFESSLKDLTALEREAVWLFVLSPAAGDSDKILRLDPRTIAATMTKTQETLRPHCDRLNSEMLSENRHLLAETTRAQQPKECPDPKEFLRLLDGQITWRGRVEAEHHLTLCWRCVDLMCRFREVAALARLASPLSVSAAEPYWKALGLNTTPPPLWKRLLRAN